MTNIHDTQERLKLYFSSKTFTFLKEIMPNGFVAVRNGFIREIHDDFIIFFDVVSIREFPIPIDKIEDIQVSAKKDMTSLQAKEIEERYYEENKI